MLTFITTTSYGSWLPGDARGWILDGKQMPVDPAIEQHSKKLMRSAAILFSAQEQKLLFQSISAAATEFNYNLRDLSIESWHLHWIIDHPDHIETMVGRLKNRMRQSLNRGRIWTEGYYSHCLLTDEAVHWARQYIAKHAGCRLSAGTVLAPGSAGGANQ